MELLMSHVKTRKRVLNSVNYCPITTSKTVVYDYSNVVYLYQTPYIIIGDNSK